MDGRTSVLHPDGDSVWVAANDPVLGPHGSVLGAALLRDYPRVAGEGAAAVKADDGLLRGVVLAGDGVVLVGADRIRLVDATHPWAHTVRRVTGKNRSPAFAIVDGYLVSQTRAPLHLVSDSRREGVLADALAGDAPVLLHDGLRVTAPDGPIVADALPRDLEVVIVDATVPGGALSDGAVTLPDVWRHDGDSWWPVVGGPGGAGQPDGGGGGGQVVLVCSEDDDEEDGACAA
jgi:hypothetical protein